MGKIGLFIANISYPEFSKLNRGMKGGSKSPKMGPHGPDLNSRRYHDQIWGGSTNESCHNGQSKVGPIPHWKGQNPKTANFGPRVLIFCVRRYFCMSWRSNNSDLWVSAIFAFKLATIPHWKGQNPKIAIFLTRGLIFGVRGQFCTSWRSNNSVLWFLPLNPHIFIEN